MRQARVLVVGGLLLAGHFAVAQSAPQDTAQSAPQDTAQSALQDTAQSTPQNTAQSAPAPLQGNTLQGDSGARPGNDIGTRSSLPRSPVASNINGMDTKSTIAPTPPAPPVPAGSYAGAFLVSANAALAQHQTGTADEALERAETEILQRGVIAGQETNPSADPVVTRIEQARQQIGDHDAQGAASTIQSILASNAPELSL